MEKKLEERNGEEEKRQGQGAEHRIDLSLFCNVPFPEGSLMIFVSYSLSDQLCRTNKGGSSRLLPEGFTFSPLKSFSPSLFVLLACVPAFLPCLIVQL